MACVFYTASSLDGFIADPAETLSWLLTRDVDGSSDMGFETFRPRLGAAVMGASTWQWLLDHDEEAALGGLPTWVLSHREFPAADGVTFTAADDLDGVRRVHAAAVEAAGGKDVWMVGGGDLAGQWADAGLLDEMWVQLAPVTLGSGSPLMPRRLELRLEEVVRNRDFACTRYAVLPGGTLSG